MQPLFMPRHLDDQMTILVWPADEMLPVFAWLIVGVLINQKLICLGIGILAMRFFRKMKEGHPDGYLLHALYWTGLVTGKVRTLPNPYIREFLI
ncbi:MAG: type IV conjugative transfer system protein TraL [Rhodospirillaceae bacterium]|nr:type IV conjugative transfer system protein TraL [Rhodospirillaceae bacterium]